MIIGGLGGSGTRVASGAARSSGYWMGDNLKKKSDDSRHFGDFLDKWLDSMIDFPDVSALRACCFLFLPPQPPKSKTPSSVETRAEVNLV